MLRPGAFIYWALLAINLALCAHNLLTGKLLSAGYTFTLSVVWLLLALGARRRLSLKLNLLLLASLVASLVLIFVRYREVVRR